MGTIEKVDRYLSFLILLNQVKNFKVHYKSLKVTEETIESLRRSFLYNYDHDLGSRVDLDIGIIKMNILNEHFTENAVNFFISGKMVFNISLYDLTVDNFINELKKYADKTIKFNTETYIKTSHIMESILLIAEEDGCQ
jgi:hypothetical protein